MRARNGFTLVEAIVVGVIGSIIAGFFIAFMFVHNDVVNRGVAQAILQRQSETVSSTIGAAVRSSGSVFAEGETWNANPQLAQRKTNFIMLYDRSGNLTRVFRIGIVTYRLSEGTNASNRKIMTTGSDTVRATQGSSFILSADRKRVTLDIGYQITYRGKPYSLPAKKDGYLCRN